MESERKWRTVIYDTLDNIHLYAGLQPEVVQGLRYLAETDFSQRPDGRQELAGDDLFANLMHYETKEANDTPEAHREYIDIQYLVEGEELVGVAPLSAMTGVAEAHPERDLWLYHGPTQPLTIGKGRFLVLWPNDAHAPGIAVDGVPAPCRKCVVKVRVK